MTARAPTAFPAPISSLRNWMPIRRATVTGGEPVGQVTSGGFGPTVNAPVALGYVPTALAVTGTPLFAEVRGKRLPVSVSSLPFITQRYKRT